MGAPSKTTKKTKLNDSTNSLKKASINLNINNVRYTDSDYINTDGEFEEDQEFKEIVRYEMTRDGSCLSCNIIFYITR